MFFLVVVSLVGFFIIIFNFFPWYFIEAFLVGQEVLCFLTQEVFILSVFSVDPAEKKSKSFSVIGR